MDRGAWQAIVHGVARVRHDLVTKSPGKIYTKHRDERLLSAEQVRKASCFKKNNCYLFLAVLGVRRFVWAFSSCSEQGPHFIEVRGLLIAVAFLAAEHRVQACRLQQQWLEGPVVDTRALLLRGMWNLSGLGIEPMSFALADRFLHCATREV